MNTEQLLREYIAKTIHMSLSTARDNMPWTCEVHFSYDDNLNLYFKSLTSRRHSQEIAENPNVSGNIVRQHELGELPIGVYFEGTARLLTEEIEIAAAADVIVARQGADKAAIIADANKSDGHKFYKISVKNYYLFGKFGQSSNAKYVVEWNK